MPLSGCPRPDARRIDPADGYPLLERERSRPEYGTFHRPVPGALSANSERQSVGLLAFDAAVADPTATSRAVNLDSEAEGGIPPRRSERASAQQMEIPLAVRRG